VENIHITDTEKGTRSHMKVMLIAFFGMEGIVHSEFLS
jgi:hypothetical protein